MNIYLVERKNKYYGSGATNRMVVIAENEVAALHTHPDSPDDIVWVESEGVWINWCAAEMYRPNEIKNEARWPGPSKLAVTLIGTATEGHSQWDGAIVLADTER